MSAVLPLRELLRRRQRLPPLEVASLLPALPRLIDAAGARLPSNPLLHEVAVRFETEPNLARVIAEDVRGWPAFALEMSEEDPAEEDAEMTVLSPKFAQRGSPAVRFAALLYELLGGRIRYEELVAGRYSPIAPLGEQGNEMLQEALGHGAFADCRSVWEAWRATVPGLKEESVAGPRPGWRIPASLLTVAESGTVLELRPAGTAMPPLRLVARPEFRIGRSRRSSDLALIPREEDEAARAIIEEISRVHVVAASGASGFSFRDGTPEHASVNGALWQDETLSQGAATPLNGPGMLILSPKGCRYQIEVWPIAAQEEGDGEIENLHEWSGAGDATLPPAAPRFGAVTFQAPDHFALARKAVWLLSAVRGEASPAGEIFWGSKGEGAQLFLHRAGAFWIARLGPRSPVVLDGLKLSVGEIAPLAAGQTLEIGMARFTVKLPVA